MIHIASYNVNGIRSAVKKGFLHWLETTPIDILCLQEIRADSDQIPIEQFESLGYRFALNTAQKRGYSGVGILSKIPPKKIVHDTLVSSLEGEGRIIRFDFNQFSVISLYMPSASNLKRLAFKFKFMDDFQSYVDGLKIEFPNLIICGDYNICHRAMDIHDPIRNKNVSGFLPEERTWLDGFIHSGFIDSFRYLNPDPNHYTWWSYRTNARERNLGWRIDYCMVSDSLKNNIRNSYISSNVVHSDHCPTGVFIDIQALSSLVKPIGLKK